MPELPEVETVCRGLSPAMLGSTIKSVELRRPNLRFPFPAGFVGALEGRRIDALTRRAKYILVHLDDGAALVIHLGMSGRILILSPSSAPNMPGEFYQDVARHEKHDHVVFDLSNGIRILYNDVRRFGFMDLARSDALEESSHFRGLGIEPLGNEFNADALSRLFAGKSTSLKAALLDQGLVCGLGNIYVCEALHRSGLSPFKPAGETAGNKPVLERLTAEIRLVLEEAIEAGGSTLRDYAHADGSLGYFQHRFKAYDRKGEACSRAGCGGKISRIVQSGRSTFFCADCQV